MKDFSLKDVQRFVQKKKTRNSSSKSISINFAVHSRWSYYFYVPPESILALIYFLFQLFIPVSPL